MQQRKDDAGVIIRRDGNSLIFTGISFTFLITILSVVFTFGQQKEKISALECATGTLAGKLDKVAEKVDNVNGKMDILINNTRGSR